DSVVAMVGLNEALERIDSSFNYAMLGKPDAHAVYLRNWKEFDRCLGKEQDNITLPGERELVEELSDLSRAYRAAGDRFFAAGPPWKDLSALYLGTDADEGLLALFQRIKKVAEDIRLLNQHNMEEVNDDARHLAGASRYWLAAALAGTTLLAA